MATKTKTAPTDNVVRFAFANETKGAVRYEEVGTDGKAIEPGKQRIGTLYFRKNQFGTLSADWASEGKPPVLVTITVTCSDK